MQMKLFELSKTLKKHNKIKPLKDILVFEMFDCLVIRGLRIDQFNCKEKEMRKREFEVDNSIKYGPSNVLEMEQMKVKSNKKYCQNENVD